MKIVIAAVGGLLLGSFFNVVIWRLPRGESLNHPPSHCPKCGTPVKPYDNIPVLSWLVLRGKCRHCANPISARYPGVELLTAVLTTAVAIAKHSAHDIALDEVLVLTLVPVAFIDFDHRIIPNRILAPAAIAAVVIGVITHASGLPEQLIAGAGAGMFFFLFALAWPSGMGMGDVKLAGVLGLFLGRNVVVAIFAALITGVIVGVGIMSRSGVSAGRKTAIPFGPFLAIGALLGILVGPSITHWYLYTVI